MFKAADPHSLPEAVVFVGFRHKRQGLEGAKKLGLKTVLVTDNNASQAEGLFDHIVEGDITSTTFMDECADLLKKNYQVKAVVTNYEHYVLMRAYLAQALSVPTASVTAVACSRNKALQRQALAGLPFNVDFKIITTLKEAKKALHQLGGDVFLKSIAGIKSRMVFHVESEAELEQAFTQLQSLTEDAQEGLYHLYQDFPFDSPYPDPTHVFLVEKAEQGQQVTVSSFMGQSQVWHAPSLCDVYSASTLGRSDSFLAFRILPSRFDSKIVSAAQKVMEDTAHQLKLIHSTLYAEMFIQEDGQIKLIELASRMGGYRALMYKSVYDLDLNEMLLKNALGLSLEENQELKPKKYVSAVEIFPESEGILDSIEAMEELEKDPRMSALRIVKKKGDHVGLAKNGFEQCLSFLLEANSYQEVYGLSMDYCKKLKVQLV